VGEGSYGVEELETAKPEVFNSHDVGRDVA